MLPVKALGTSSHDIEGVAVPIRSLSRDEVVQLSDMEGAPGEAEVFILSRSCGITPDEAREWRTKVDAETADGLLEAIAALSGIRGRKGGNA